MKKSILLLVAFVFLFMAGCETDNGLSQTPPADDETYTCAGLTEIIEEVGQAVDLMEGVTCSDSDGNDVTNQVTTTVIEEVIFTADQVNPEIDENLQAVYLVKFSIGSFEGFRRISFKNDDTVNPDDLLGGWGLFTEDHVSSSSHMDYPREVYRNINPLLNCLLFRVTSVSESDNWPQYYFDKELTLDSTKTYTVTMQVRGAQNTSFRFDFVNFSDQANLTFVDVETVVPLTTVPVTTSEGLTEVSFIVTPLMDTDEGIFRIILGSSGTVNPSGEIHIDNIEIVENP